MTQTNGSDQAAARGWRIRSQEPPDVTAEGQDRRSTVWFESDDLPDLRVVLTVLPDGAVVGVEVHAKGTERAAPYPQILVWDDGLALLDEPLADVSISTRVLRRVPVAQLAELARDSLLEQVQATAEVAVARALAGRPAGPAEMWTEMARELRGDVKRPGRRGRLDRYYATLAVAYEDSRHRGERMADLARRMNVTVSQLRSSLHEARGKGMLTPTTQGRAGGVATELARDLLREVDDEESG